MRLRQRGVSLHSSSWSNFRFYHYQGAGCMLSSGKEWSQWDYGITHQRSQYHQGRPAFFPTPPLSQKMLTLKQFNISEHQEVFCMTTSRSWIFHAQCLHKANPWYELDVKGESSGFILEASLIAFSDPPGAIRSPRCLGWPSSHQISSPCFLSPTFPHLRVTRPDRILKMKS